MSLSYDEMVNLGKVVKLNTPAPPPGEPSKKLDEINWDTTLGNPHGVVGDNGIREPANDLARYKDMVNHPPHYTSHPSGIECIDVVRHMPYNIGVAMAYLWRHEQKGGTEDLRKAIWHIEDQIKWREKCSTAKSSGSDADGYHGC